MAVKVRKKIPMAKSTGKKAGPGDGSYQKYLTGIRKRFPEATGQQLVDKKYISKDYKDTYDFFYGSGLMDVDPRGDGSIENPFKDPKGGPRMAHSPAKMGHKSPMKKETAKQEKKNLLKDMPIDKRGSAMQMGHSPAEMGHSPMQNHHYGKRKASAIKMGHESPAKMSGSWMTKHSKSALHMGHKSPAKMGHDSPAKKHCI